MNVESRRSICHLFTHLVVLICTLAVFGCNSSSTNTLSGKYIDEVNPQNYTEFNTDGTFSVHKDNNKIGGIYSVEGKNLTLVINTGQTFKGKIEGKSIIGETGGRSTKQ